MSIEFVHFLIELFLLLSKNERKQNNLLHKDKEWPRVKTAANERENPKSQRKPKNKKNSNSKVLSRDILRRCPVLTLYRHLFSLVILINCFLFDWSLVLVISSVCGIYRKHALVLVCLGNSLKLLNQRTSKKHILKPQSHSLIHTLSNKKKRK
jgi:hypothetical protein